MCSSDLSDELKRLGGYAIVRPARAGRALGVRRKNSLCEVPPFLALTQMVGKVLEYFVSNSIDIFETINRHPLKTAP